jgi:hypothetical protein
LSIFSGDPNEIQHINNKTTHQIWNMKWMGVGWIAVLLSVGVVVAAAADAADYDAVVDHAAAVADYDDAPLLDDAQQPQGFFLRSLKKKNKKKEKKKKTFQSQGSKVPKNVSRRHDAYSSSKEG